MADISPGVAFVAMQPCRVLDTRGANGPYGGPRLAANQTRNFDIDSGPCTGIPAGVEAYSMNFGAIFPDGASSFITIWPTGSAQPVVSSINPILGGVVANAAVVPAGTNGQISVLANTGVHLYGDINGYFTGALNAGNQAVIVASVPDQGALRVENTAVAATATAVLGTASAATGITWGVLGITHSPFFGSAGVRGVALDPFGSTVGVHGATSSTGGWAAGVYGVDGSGAPGQNATFFSAGVRGVSTSGVGVIGQSSTSFGIYGVSNDQAIIGVHVHSLSGIVAGYLGRDDTYAVYGSGGGIGATGPKSFIEPHPTDPTKEIAYVSLEGPEAGTYFRGEGEFQRGTAIIQVPEDFRMVTDAKGLSIQVTPIGEMATVAVGSIGLDRIVVKGSRDVKFFYTVNGVRKAFKDWNPITENAHYVPDGPEAVLSGGFAPEQRRSLIATRIYNADGTVNMDTARRLGWDKEWEKRARPAPQPEE